MRGISWIVIAAVSVAAIGAAFFALSGGDEDAGAAEVAAAETAPAEAPPAESTFVVMPALSEVALAGQSAFTDNCARCHGANGGGTNQGPPLIHIIYEPSHHGDMAFVLAAQNGSRAHHWRFGDMPPQPQVTSTEIAAIIQFVREVQRANGIF